MSTVTRNDPDNPDRECRFEFAGELLGGERSSVKVFEGREHVGTVKLQGRDGDRFLPVETPEGSTLSDSQTRELLRRARGTLA